MRSLLSGVFRLALLAAFTFAFVVLFEHGVSRFSDGIKVEWDSLVSFAGSLFLKHDKAQPAQPGKTPASASVSGVSPSKGGPPAKGTARPTQTTPAPNNSR
jgi:hypothetical protein